LTGRGVVRHKCSLFFLLLNSLTGRNRLGILLSSLIFSGKTCSCGSGTGTWLCLCCCDLRDPGCLGPIGHLHFKKLEHFVTLKIHIY